MAEQLDLVAQIDRACGNVGAKNGPSVGELVVAVAIHQACSPGALARRGHAEYPTLSARIGELGHLQSRRRQTELHSRNDAGPAARRALELPIAFRLS